MSEVKLLPLPESVEFVLAGHDNAEGYGMATAGKPYYTPEQMHDYARANMEPLIAENERLRAEVAEYANMVQGYIDTIAEADAQAERLAEALRGCRDWFEAQAKSISKGNGSSWDLMQVREQRDLCDAALEQEPQE